MADSPGPHDDKKDDMREDYRNDPDGFKDKWGVDPNSPPPETQDPRAPGKSH